MKKIFLIISTILALNLNAASMKLDLELLNSYSNFDNLDQKDTPSYGVGLKLQGSSYQPSDFVKLYAGIGLSLNYLGSSDTSMSIAKKVYTEVEFIAGVDFANRLYLWGSIGSNTLTDDGVSSTTYNYGVDYKVTKRVKVGVYKKYWEWSDMTSQQLYGNMDTIGFKIAYAFSGL